MVESNFFERVYEIVRKIPKGKVVSYGQIAKMLGMPRAARQVGWAMHSSPENVPWQRVVMSDGSIAGGEYAELRLSILQKEGVELLSCGKVNMNTCRWSGE